MAGFALINYFCEKDEKHRYFPMLKPEILIAVDIIDSIEERIGVKLENIPPVARDTAPS
jgi:hypothetical protein